MDNTLQKITVEFGKAFSIVGQAFKSPQDLKKLINALGWEIPSGFDDLAIAGVSVEELVATLQAIIESTPEEREDEMLMITRITELTVALIQFIDKVVQISNNLNTTLSSLGDYVAKTKIDQEFFKRMLDLIIISYVSRNSSSAFAIIQFLSIFEQKSFPADNTIYQTAHVRNIVHFDRIGTLLSNPGNLMEQGYGWGTTDLKANNLLQNFSFLLSTLGAEVFFNQMSRKVEEALLRKNIPEADTDPSSRAIITLLREVGDNAGAEIKLVAYKARPTSVGSTDAGIGFFPVIKGTTEINFDINENLVLSLEGEIDFTGALNLILRPNQTPYLETGMYSGAVNVPMAAKIMAGLIYGSEEGNPVTLISFPGGSKLDLQKTSLKLGVEKQMSGTFETIGELEIKNLRLVINLSSADSFLQEGAGADEFIASFDLTINWSKDGIYFKGSASLEILIPIHIEIGPIELSNVIVALKGKNEGIILELGTTIKFELGPLSVVVEDIGAKADLAFNKPSGSLGPIDFNLGFKPPNGLGLSINAGAVIGGGYLFFDFEKEEYAGVLELTIAGFISAKAIGLITTKMPDGSKGFSMLIIITAEFMPPFQLGYGFTLIGVGGLLGLNRTVLLDPLRDAVRTGAVTSIMFPQNVIANAPRIISDLKTIFPPYEGKFLIGPMAKLGWGTPTLISLSLGLIIEIPGNIAILGVLKIALPEERIAIVQIQVLFVGTIDFDKKMLTFDASLYESFILTMTLEGDMAVRLKWGDNPDFILTVGGFHPSYTPPPLALPTLRRLAINILNTSIAKIRVECYQAVTSNTVQFGARADLFFDVSVCSITGFISFDALFQFSPFYFIIEVAAGFSLKAAGISVMSVRVRMSLEGPTPWRAKGTGSVSFFFFDISADFDITWGEEKNTALPDIAILQTFIDELNKKELWSTALASNKNLLVSLRKFNDATEVDLLVLHPSGSLIVQQKLLPLKVKFDKIGNQKTSDVQKISIISANSNGEPLTVNDIDENFARAQYQNLSDAEKLSKPSFEKMPGGVSLSLGAATIKNGKLARKKVKYEITIIDKEPVKRKKGLHFAQVGVLFANFLKGNSVSKSVLSKNYTEKLQPFNEKMNVLEEGYTVAFQSNNKAYSTGATFSSEMMAQTFMQEQVAKKPSLQKEVHIISNYELQTS